MTVGKAVLAIYDFRSKQEFIYRTNRMREITGASELIAGMYKRFLRERIEGLPIRNDWMRPDATEPVVDGKPTLLEGEAGVVVYEGGGNLLVLFRDRETFKAANRRFSRIVLEAAYGLCMIAAGVEWEQPPSGSGVTPFEHNRTRAYQELDRTKRVGNAATPCNVLPYTQVDRSTFQPVVRKSAPTFGDMTREGLCKQSAFDSLPESRRAEGRFVDDLGTERGSDSLIAVLYFDGNSIGERVKTAVAEGVAMGESEVAAMRAFSLNLHATLVGNTRRAMTEAIDELDERYRGYRVIIDHGDEITLVCNAHAAPYALEAYFGAIEGTGFHACAGVAFCHSHDPFAEVYRIAEECCESGKRRNRAVQRKAMEGLSGEAVLEAARLADANYVDLHVCRSGITGSLERIRAAQEGTLTDRPFRMDGEYAAFLKAGELFARSKIRRSDLKELNRAILRGDSWYALEYERLRAKDRAAFEGLRRIVMESVGEGVVQEIRSDEDLRVRAKRLLFDVTSFADIFDLRFDEKGAGDGQEA